MAEETKSTKANKSVKADSNKSADKTVVDTQSPSIPVPTTNPEPVPTKSEDILITPEAAEAAPISADPIASPPPPVEPVVIEEKDLGGKDKEESSNDKLAEEIEVLTGEIQALEAKIERLAGEPSAEQIDQTKEDKPLPPPIAPVSETAISGEESLPINQQQSDPPPPKVEAVNPEEGIMNAVLPPKKESAPTEAEMISKPSSDATPKQVSDITPRPVLGDPFPGAPNPADEKPSQDQSEDKPASVLEVIGETISVFGIITFVLLAISPLFRNMLDSTTYSIVQQVGWIVALIALGLGFILMLFVKGKVLFKVSLFILIVLVTLVFISISNSAILEYIGGVADPILELYR